jgi:hypothetical protein
MGAAVLGIYGNSKQEAMYPVYYVDATKQKLDGANRYTVRFAPGQLPPVNAFWSLTMYEAAEPARGQSAQPLSDQLTDAAAAQARCRRRADADCPERIPRQGQGSQLAARAQGAILHDHAPLLAERSQAVEGKWSIKKVFRSSTQFSAVAYRTQLFNPEDMPNVVKIQAGYKVQPLSTVSEATRAAGRPGVDFPKIDKEMVKTGFFDYLAFALQFAPAGPEEKEIRAKLARSASKRERNSTSRTSLARAKGRSGRGREGRRSQDRAVSRVRTKEHQRLESRFALWRPRFLQRRLAQASRRRQGGIYGNDAPRPCIP